MWWWRPAAGAKSSATIAASSSSARRVCLLDQFQIDLRALGKVLVERHDLHGAGALEEQLAQLVHIDRRRPPRDELTTTTVRSTSRP